MLGRVDSPVVGGGQQAAMGSLPGVRAHHAELRAHSHGSQSRVARGARAAL